MFVRRIATVTISAPPPFTAPRARGERRFCRGAAGHPLAFPRARALLAGELEPLEQARDVERFVEATGLAVHGQFDHRGRPQWRVAQDSNDTPRQRTPREARAVPGASWLGGLPRACGAAYNRS